MWSFLSLSGFSAFLCPALSCRRLASCAYITQPLPYSGFQLGLDNGKQWKEIRGWEEEGIRQFISPSLSFAPWPFSASMHMCSGSALTWTSLNRLFPPLPSPVIGTSCCYKSLGTSPILPVPLIPFSPLDNPRLLSNHFEHAICIQVAPWLMQATFTFFRSNLQLSLFTLLTILLFFFFHSFVNMLKFYQYWGTLSLFLLTLSRCCPVVNLQPFLQSCPQTFKCGVCFPNCSNRIMSYFLLIWNKVKKT